jgi:hypothetical protein
MVFELDDLAAFDTTNIELLHPFPNSWIVLLANDASDDDYTTVHAASLFLIFLKFICGINSSTLRVLLVTHNSLGPDILGTFERLGIDTSLSFERKTKHAVGASGVLGMIRTARIEMPHIRFGCLDSDGFKRLKSTSHSSYFGIIFRRWK